MPPMKQPLDPHQTTTDASALSECGKQPVLTNGPLFWRSLDELAEARADSEAGVHAAALDHDLLELAAPGLGPSSRREFFRLMAASMALGGMSGCAIQPSESIVPYVESPEQIVPGKPLFFT